MARQHEITRLRLGWSHWFGWHVWEAFHTVGHVHQRTTGWRAVLFPRRAFGFRPARKPRRLIMVRGCLRYYRDLPAIRDSLKCEVAWTDF